MKLLRRSIIAVCSIMMVPILMTVFTGFPKGKYYSKELKALVKKGRAEVIEVNRKLNIDGDIIYIERIINTDTESNIRYRTLEKPGWSFPGSVLVLYDDKGKKLIGGYMSSGWLWRQDGIITYERIDKDSKEITIKLEWYDRSGEIIIPINKGGDK